MKSTFTFIILFFAIFIGAGNFAVSAQNPPDHAKAYGVKKKYRFYPESNVYFDVLAKRYTYRDGGKWITGTTLPKTIRLTGTFSDFDFDGDDPWKENTKHKEKYKIVKTDDLKKIENTFDSNSDNGSQNKGNKNKNK